MVGGVRILALALAVSLAASAEEPVETPILVPSPIPVGFLVAWKPMLQGLQKREQDIHSAIEEAHKTREEARRLHEQLQAVAKGGQFHHDEHFAKAVKSAKKLVPSKYSLVDTSGLEREVKPATNTIAAVQYRSHGRWYAKYTITEAAMQRLIPPTVSAFGVTRVRARPVIQRVARRRVPSV